MNDIKERLLELPESIRTQKEDILTKHREVEVLIRQSKEWEVRMMNNITNAVDDKGKPVYSNDIKRQGALMELQAQDQEYLKLKTAINDLTLAIKKAEIEMDFLYNTQSNLKAICYIGTEIR